MIEHEAVVSVIHLEQRRACELVAVAVLHESTTDDAQATAGIGEAHNRLLGSERLHAEPKALGTGKRGLQFEDGDLFAVTRETLDADGNRLPAFPCPDLDLLPVLLRELHGRGNMLDGDDRRRG